MEAMKKYPNGMLCREGARTTMKLSNSEFLVECPYDQSHHVLHNRFGDHLRKCRGNYERQRLLKGELAAMASCRYNASHKFFPPERSYHEHNCDDKRVKAPFLSQGLFYENGEPVMPLGQDGSDAGASGGGGGEPLSTDVKGVNWSGVGVGAMGVPHKDTDMPFSGYGLYRKSPSRLGGIPHVISQTMDPEAFGYNHRRPYIPKRCKIAAAETKAVSLTGNPAQDALNLRAANKRQGFDWYEHQYNLTGPLRIYPPGLTKSERKKYDIYNTLRLKYEEGIFVEPEEQDYQVNQKGQKKIGAAANAAEGKSDLGSE